MEYLDNLKEYNLLTAKKIDGGFNTKYTVSLIHVL